MCPIGAAEYKPKEDSITIASEGGGAPAQNQVVVQCASQGLREMHLKNMGNEDLTYALLSRGKTVPVVAEDVTPLQVGATAQFQGFLANRQIVPGTLDINDAVGAQDVIDDGVSVDGVGQIVDKAVPATVVGTIVYETGYIDFTWMAAFGGGASTAVYSHTSWTPFAAPITGSAVQGGGIVALILIPNGGDNYVDGIKGNTYVGVMAYSSGQGSKMHVRAVHDGDDTLFKLVPPPRFRNLNSPLT